MSPLAIADACTTEQDEHLTAHTLAPLSRLNYGSDLKRIACYLTQELGLERVDQVQPRYLDGVHVTLNRRGPRGSSRRRHIATICSLCRFLVR